MKGVLFLCLFFTIKIIKEGNPMRLIKCVVVFGSCLLFGACIFWKGDLDIDIGDYENQLDAWNSQNMLDY
jgi:hypothetical protein